MHRALPVTMLLSATLVAGGCVTMGSPFLYLDRYSVQGLLFERTEVGTVLVPAQDDLGPAGTTYEITYSSAGRFTYRTAERAGTGQYAFQQDAFCRSFDGGLMSCSRIAETPSGYVASSLVNELLGRQPNQTDLERRTSLIANPRLSGLRYAFSIKPTGSTPADP